MNDMKATLSILRTNNNQILGGEQKYNYPGENNKNSIVAFLKNPSPASAEPKPTETPWAEEQSAVNHLVSML
jgi:hypothetical protein